MSTAQIGADVFHAHWPGAVASIQRRAGAVSGSASRLYRIRAARRTGGAFVWTVHNLRTMGHRIRGCTTCSGMSWFAVSMLDYHQQPRGRRDPDQVAEVERVSDVVHPHGLRRPPPSPRPEDAGETRTASAVGQLRRYKAADDLITAFERLPNPDYRLLIVGSPRKDLGQSLASMSSDPRITCDLRRIPDGEVPSLFRPSRSDGPSLSPDHQFRECSLGALARCAGPRYRSTERRLQDQVGDQWVRLWNPEEPLEIALDRELPRDRPSGLPDLDRNDWTTIAESTMRLYEAVR